jgi:hypothetical protein
MLPLQPGFWFDKSIAFAGRADAFARMMNKKRGLHTHGQMQNTHSKVSGRMAQIAVTFP